jgi:hypothetical protein
VHSRDIYYAETMPLQAPDPSWLDEDSEVIVQDPRFTRWDTPPEADWEEFSLEHDATQFIRADALPTQDWELALDLEEPQDLPKSVDDTFEQMVLAGGFGLAVAGGMCLLCASLGFVAGLLVAT